MTPSVLRAAAVAVLLCSTLVAAPAAAAQTAHVPPAPGAPYVDRPCEAGDGDSPFEPTMEAAEDLLDRFLGEGNPISEQVIDEGADELLDELLGTTC
ncbi:hypothetical protein [Streptomyces sp. NPDC097619]|uniref:hypothetical protein n=1 Tax=Streptomyces sp. NPDC097619 TaxID=3157228 RepID=UPI003324D05A